MKLIDADALMQSLGITNMDCDECAWQDKEWSRCKRGGDFEDACCAIEDAPIIEERKKGRWISADEIFHGIPFYCSECGEKTMDTVMWKPRWNFCPNCGADMREETNDQRTN